MTNTRTILLLGGTGKTARRIAPRLVDAGVEVRTAARSGADVRFDWSDTATHGPALDGVDAVYLVPPALRLDFAPDVAAFLDRAEAAGVGHVTFLSARGVDQLPPEVALRAVELDLAGRATLTHSVLRPSWFMQNFSEYVFLPTILESGTIAAPTGDGAEAFIHADDIADAAAATLLDPAAHAGAGYELTGPEPLTFAEVAERIAPVAGRSVVHVDADPEQWVADAVAGGVPDDYAGLLAGLLGVIRDGHGAEPGDGVLRATGHEPRSFAEYLADPATVAAWTTSVPA
jgi:uncharacterized protein YbjT (DUF2867 family)